MRTHRLFRGFLVIGALQSALLAADGIPNWPAPPFWSPPTVSHGLKTLGDVGPPQPFIPETPCRVVDTRGASGTFGGPIFAAGETRTYPLSANPACPGFPPAATIAAYSVNITVTQTAGPGFVSTYPSGTTRPLVSSVNFTAAAQSISNAAIVPAGSGGSAGNIDVYASQQTHIIIDVNGYYGNTPAASSNYFSVINSGLYAVYGETSNPGAFAAGVYGRATAGQAQGLFGETLSTNDGTAGVFGRATATTGNNFGVAGQTNSSTDNARGVHGSATATTGVTFGVVGRTNSATNNASGVFGRAAAGSGVTYGVHGLTSSSTDFTAGVLGEATSTTGEVFGVIGVSQSQVSGVGVAGAIIDSVGNPLYYGVLGSAIGTAGDTTGPPWGVFAFGNSGATGTKHFVEPHPSDPTKVILYSSLEGREVGTYFRGTSRIVNHQAVIEVPEDFRIVTDDDGLTVQLTPVGDLATLAVVSQDLNQIVVKASRDVTFHYLVQGVRRAFKDLQPVRIGYEFVPRSPADTMQPFLTQEARRRLIANGTYNADGTVNMETAERLGWAKAWRESGVKTKFAPLARPPADPGTAEEK